MTESTVDWIAPQKDCHAILVYQNNKNSSLLTQKGKLRYSSFPSPKIPATYLKTPNDETQSGSPMYV
jgi:hypothetical protein